MGKTLLDKVWEMHKVTTLQSGLDQLFIGLHMIHEVTSPQAFAMLDEKKLSVAFPERVVATVDHIVPTDSTARPLKDPLAEEMLVALENNTKKHGITYFGLGHKQQGIVHIVGPENGITQPGMTIVCGDSHTSTHGAFGALAFGIGTSQIRDVLASGCLAIAKPKLRKVEVTGKLNPGVTAKDVVLRIIHDLGVKGGIGYAYEYCGEVFDNFTMEERMTVCNMSIEGGARMGYVQPDQTTFDYLKGREYSPGNFDKAVEFWHTLRSDEDAVYDDVYTIDGSTIEPMVTYGINPGQSVAVTDKIPMSISADEEETFTEALEHMEFARGDSMIGKPVNVTFIGSCTNGRISDLRAAAEMVKKMNGKKVAPGVRALVVPGSVPVKEQAEAEGLDKIFSEAGFKWRNAGCSMCLAMNPDKLIGNELCASSSNRNFKGRQGSPTGRTLLMSPAMVVLAALEGKVCDVREYL
jgi:3-isopropylmalate/(R)-2-methylmalate dehydratase large subunit